MSCNNRAFTLIEVMIALVLLGLIATIVAAGTRLSMDMSRRGERKAASLRTGEIERNALRAQVQGALPFRYTTQDSNNNNVSQIAFDGGPDRIRFISRYGLYDGPNGFPRWVELREEGSPGRLAVEEYRIVPPDNQPSGTPAARAEFENCGGLNIQYLDTSGDVPQWISSWNVPDHKAPLPSAVGIQCGPGSAGMKWVIPLDYAEAANQGVRFQ